MRFLAPLLVLAGTIPALSITQDRPSQTPRPGTEPGANAQSSKSDGILAGWLQLGSNNEVQLGQLAQQQAQGSEVKQFAQKMVEDHREMAQKLQPFATAAGFSGRTDGVTAGRDTAPGQSRPRPAGVGAGVELDVVAVLEELGKEHLESARNELEQKSGEEFDRCYVGAMVASHMKSKDMFTVFQRHASGELKSVLEDGQQTVEMHLQEAKDLAKKLESKATGGR